MSTNNSDITAARLQCVGQEKAQYLIDRIYTQPNFPKEGILFRDFVPVFADAQALQILQEALTKSLPVNVDQIDAIAGLEARGFLLGPMLASDLGKSCIAVRKPGKLPGNILEEQYTLEYGVESLQIEANAIKKGQRVLIVDDLIATGGSARAAANLVRRCGGVVAGFLFVMELDGLHGVESLGEYPSSSLVTMPA